MHSVEQLQEAGVYRDVYVGDAPSDFDIEPDKDLAVFEDDKVRLTKYYGLVPRHLLKAAQQEEEDEEVEELVANEESDSYYVEAIVVIANDGTLLKAEENPYHDG